MNVIRGILQGMVVGPLLLTLPLCAEPAPEYALKAAYIYNFATFTDWPPSSIPDGAQFKICIRADNPMRAAVTELTEKKVKGRQAQVKTWESMEDLHSCHIVVLDEKDRERARTLKKTLGSASVLTISDDDLVFPSPSIILLSQDSGKLSFIIDASVARQVGLLFNAKLLRLAKSVQ